MSDPYNITMDDLAVTFPSLIQVLTEMKYDALPEYMDKFFGNKYDLIPKSNDLVKAFEVATSKNIDIYFYTNGPSAHFVDEIAHVQKIMQRSGFSDKVIEYMRTKTYDLNMSVKMGRAKPAPESMTDFLEFSNIDPNDALMADDTIDNLITANEFGLSTIWTWTSNQAPKSSDVKKAASINAVQVRDTAGTLLNIANAYTL